MSLPPQLSRFGTSVNVGTSPPLESHFYHVDPTLNRSKFSMCDAPTTRSVKHSSELGQ